MTGPEFWASSGFHLLRREPDGRLAVTADFLRAYLARPELRADEAADPKERALAARLSRDPLGEVAASETRYPTRSGPPAGRSPSEIQRTTGGRVSIRTSAWAESGLPSSMTPVARTV